jgi:hypothetical protein
VQSVIQSVNDGVTAWSVIHGVNDIKIQAKSGSKKLCGWSTMVSVPFGLPIRTISLSPVWLLF